MDVDTPYFEAVGALITSIELHQPGFLARMASDTESPRHIAVVREWAERMGKDDDDKLAALVRARKDQVTWDLVEQSVRGILMPLLKEWDVIDRTTDEIVAAVREQVVACHKA